MSEFTPEQRLAVIDRVIAGLSEGIPLAVLCREDGMPGRSTFYEWMEGDEKLSGRIACARDDGYDVIASDALAIVDAEPERVVTVTGEDRSESRIDSAAVQWAKNRAETRLKLLAKWDPKRYGDKQLVGSDPDNPLPAGINVTFKS